MLWNDLTIDVRFFMKKYIFALLLSLTIISIGFFKFNIVFSSTGIGHYKSKLSDFATNLTQEENILGNFEDKSFIKIYKEDYGYDFVINLGDTYKIFTFKFPV